MYNTESDTRRLIERELMNSERILWCGQPGGGIVLRVEDIFMIPFGIVWLGFSLFWQVMVIFTPPKTTDSPKWIPLLFIGVPFLLIGIYFLAGRFYADIWMRRHTYYAVTNRRIIILKKWLFGSTKSLELSQLPPITLSVKPGKSKGNIILGDEPTFQLSFGGHTNYQTIPPRLDALENVRDVHEIILNAQRDLRNTQ